jgi:hypothetical protein
VAVFVSSRKEPKPKSAISVYLVLLCYYGYVSVVCCVRALCPRPCLYSPFDFIKMLPNLACGKQESESGIRTSNQVVDLVINELYTGP